MNNIILGIVAFLFFAIYDINSVTKKRQLFGGSFFIGFILLIISTVGIVTSSLNQTAAGNLGIVYFILAVLFLILLIYTLFMAIPFKDTYIKAGNKPAVCESGVYALCRHPGVLWFTGFYFFTWLALPSPLMLAAAAIFSILNIVYVIFQDRWTFMLAFENYNEYKKTTPFLVPNLGSIKKCMRTIF